MLMCVYIVFSLDSTQNVMTAMSCYFCRPLFCKYIEGTVCVNIYNILVFPHNLDLYYVNSKLTVYFSCLLFIPIL